MDAHRPKWCSRCKDEVQWQRVQERVGRRISSRKRCVKCGWPVSTRRPKVSSPRKRADDLWSALVKRGRTCMFIGRTVNDKMHECMGPLEAMHGIPRGYHGTRWDLRNGFPGCARVHKYYTHKKEEWMAWMLAELGHPLFDELWHIALTNRTKEPREALANLQQRMLEEERFGT